jgi:hypothetical protein
LLAVIIAAIEPTPLGEAAVLAAGASRGRAVLGHYPEYVRMAERLRARRFNIPASVWDRMTDAERWAANQRFLDRMIRRGDDIHVATPLDSVRPGTYFEKELQYLGTRGFTPSPDGTRLIKP